MKKVYSIYRTSRQLIFIQCIQIKKTREKGTERLLKEMIAENFQNLGRDINNYSGDIKDIKQKMKAYQYII